MTTTVINIHNRLHMLTALASGRFVRCDRKSPYGNPYMLVRDGDRDEVIAKHRADLFAMSEQQQRQIVWHLKDHVLGCHCKPLPCHCDNYADLCDEWEFIMPGNVEVLNLRRKFAY